MTTPLQANTPPNPTVTAAAGPAPQEPPRRKPSPKEDAQHTDVRLVIEEAQDGKGFVYKTLDRRTGEVLQVLPREDVLKMAEDDRYAPGTVIDQRS